MLRSLERGEVSLDDAVAAYERGSQLKQQCQQRLDEARLRVDQIRAAKGSSEIDGTAPFDAEEAFYDHNTPNNFGRCRRNRNRA